MMSLSKRKRRRRKVPTALLVQCFLLATLIVFVATTRLNPAPDCSVVLCLDGPLEGGLNNQLHGFFGLVLIAVESSEPSCICAPDVRYTYPKAPKRRSKPISDGVDLSGGNWHPGLPRIYGGGLFRARLTPGTKVRTVSWKEAWDSYGEYVSKLRSAARKDGSAGPPDRHPLEMHFFRSVVGHPSERIAEVLGSLDLPDEYIAIHARVERDMRAHRFWEEHGYNLSSILRMVHKGLAGEGNGDGAGRHLDERAMRALDNVIVAVGTDLVEEDAAVLASGRALWSAGSAGRDAKAGKGAIASLQRLEKPNSFDYWDASLLDLIVCIRATLFVGFSGSTFSNNVAFLRNEPTSTFDYSSGELVEQRLNGLVPLPKKGA